MPSARRHSTGAANYLSATPASYRPELTPRRSFSVSTRSLRAWGLVAAAALSTASLAACADNTDSEGAGASTSPSSSVERNDELAALVPDEIASRGTLTVGTDPTYAPNEFQDDSDQIVGFDIDLFDAVAGKLGLTVEYQASTFDNIIPGVQGGSYDVGVSSFTDNAEREQVVDMITYFEAGTQWAQPTGGDVDPDDACGLTVAVQTGTVQLEDITARSEACTAAGNEAIEILQFDDQGQATNSVVLGQAQAVLADSPVMAYAVQQSNDALELAGDVYDAAPYGYVVAKDGGLSEAIHAAVQSLIDDGTYADIVETWGLSDGALSQSEINGASGS
jgi:polar amino acid transport system substrate-binding protein